MRGHLLTFLLLTGIVACTGMKDYSGFHVISAKANNKQDMQFLRNLTERFDLTFLREPSLAGTTDIAVSKEKMQTVKQALSHSGLDFTVEAADLQEQITAERRGNMAGSSRSSSQRNLFPNHQSYYPFWEVNGYLKTFAHFHHDVAVLKTMNQKTYENRTVYYLELGYPVGDNHKPVIILEGLTHAREWVSAAALLYTIDMLLRGYRQEIAPVAEALRSYTWVIVPVVNPDGYVHTWKQDRFWRKNRRVFDNGCIGVDLNRNYDVKWGTTGVNMDCNDYSIYPGDAAFSERETQNIRDLFLSLKPRVAAFVSVHAFSQLLLHPWGYVDSFNTSETPSNVKELIRVGLQMKKKLPNYDFGTPFEVLGYGASGASEDWSLHEKPGIYSYTFELRPKTEEEGHFLLPPRQIVPTGRELMSSLLVMAQNILL